MLPASVFLKDFRETRSISDCFIMIVFNFSCQMVAPEWADILRNDCSRAIVRLTEAHFALPKSSLIEMPRRRLCKQSARCSTWRTRNLPSESFELLLALPLLLAG